MDLDQDSFLEDLDLQLKLAADFAFACQKQKKRKTVTRRRRYWQHPILELRESCGAYHSLHTELQQNSEKFFEYTRMSQQSFHDLLLRVQGYIARQDTQLQRAIPAEERLGHLEIPGYWRDIVLITFPIPDWGIHPFWDYCRHLLRFSCHSAARIPPLTHK